MGIHYLWRHVDPLTVQQAAAIIADCDPNAVRFDTTGSPSHFETETGWTDRDGIDSVLTAFTALVNAINGGKLKATIRRTAWERGWDEEPDDGERFTNNVELLQADVVEAWEANPTYAKIRGVIYRVEPDWGKTTVERDCLCAWLAGNGIHTGFFFSEKTSAPDYLNKDHHRYSAKLAAAVKAWLAMEDENLLRGKKPIAAMESYLNTNYKELGLVHKWDGEKNGYKAGDMNKGAISDVAKIANWEFGGPTKTPIREPAPPES